MLNLIRSYRHPIRFDILSQQEFLLESIRKVPELVESKKQMTNQIEKEENEISEKNKIFSTQEEKIKSMEIESKGTISISTNKVESIFPVVIWPEFRMG